MVVMIAGIHISQEIFPINVFKALKSSLEHRRKHVLRLLRLYGDQAWRGIQKESYWSTFVPHMWLKVSLNSTNSALRPWLRIEVRPMENDFTRLYKNGDISVVITCS